MAAVSFAVDARLVLEPMMVALDRRSNGDPAEADAHFGRCRSERRDVGLSRLKKAARAHEPIESEKGESMPRPRSYGFAKGVDTVASQKSLPCVLMVCEALGGGVFAYVQQLCNDMAGEFDVSLAYAQRSQTPDGFVDGFDSRVRLMEVPGFGDLAPACVVRTVRRLREIEREVRPDIIHLHSSIAGGVGRLAFSAKRCEVVYTPHGYAFALMPPGKKAVAYHALEHVLGRRDCTTLTCCKSEDDVARTLTKRTAFIETGIDLADFDRRLRDVDPERDKRFTVYTLGRACDQKQPAVFNRIAELVPEARFIWIGSGELEGELTASNVEITGWKSRYEALALAKGADAFVLCSLGEAIAMSLIENMCIGKLALVSDVMGNRSVIRDGVNGWVCREPEEYAARIREAMAEYPQELADRARRDVEETYNTEAMRAKYASFYKQLAGCNAAPTEGANGVAL